MNRKNILLAAFILFTVIVQIAVMQDCRAQSKEEDSLVRTQQEWFANTLREREIQHLKDSIALAFLQTQLHKGQSASEQKVLRQKLDSIQARDSLTALVAKDSIETLRANVNPIPVILLEDTLFRICASLGPYPAHKRVADLEVKLKYLYDLPKYEPDSLLTDFHSDISLITYKGEVIAAVTYIDAIWANTDLRDLLYQYTHTINTTVVRNREDNSWNRTMMRIGVALMVIVLMCVVIYCLNRGFMFLVRWLVRNKSKKIQGIRINNYRLFSRVHVQYFLLQLLKVLRIVMIVCIIYAAFTFILSRFPYTRGWAAQTMDWIMQPIWKGFRALVGYLPKLFTIALILVVYHFLNKVLFALGRAVEIGSLRIKGFYAEWGLVTYKIIRFVLIVLAIVSIFPYLPGAHSDVFKGVSVFIGVLISIGSSSAIANTIAGLVITYMRPFKLGDWIKVGDSIGYVIEKNLLVTRLRTLQNEDITLPNTTILTGKTINYSESSRDDKCKGLIITIEVTIDYEVNWRTVTDLLLASAAKSEKILKNPAPFVLQKDFNNYNIGYQLNAYINEPENMFFIHSDLMHVVMDIFANAGVEIRSPDYLNFNDVTKRNWE